MKIKHKNAVAIIFDKLELGDVFVWPGCSEANRYWMRISTMEDGNAVNLDNGNVIEFQGDESVIKIHGYFVVEEEDL